MLRPLVIVVVLVLSPAAFAANRCFDLQLRFNLDAINSGTSGVSDFSDDLLEFGLAGRGNIYADVSVDGRLAGRLDFSNYNSLRHVRGADRFCYKVPERYSTFFKDVICKAKMRIASDRGPGETVVDIDVRNRNWVMSDSDLVSYSFQPDLYGSPKSLDTVDNIRFSMLMKHLFTGEQQYYPRERLVAQATEISCED